MRSLIVLMFMITINYGFSQIEKPRYNGGFEMGLVNGSQDPNGYLQTVHGVSMKNFFAGAGTGIDYYRVRTVPVFLQINQHLGKGATRPFLSASVGMNVAWPTDDQKQIRNTWWQQNESEFSKGFFTSAGAGVSFNNLRKTRFTISATWSYKTFKEHYKERLSGPWPQPSTAPVEKTLEYKLKTIRIGGAVLF